MIETRVIDNFLDKDVFDNIKQTIESNSFPWFFEKEVTYPGQISDEYYLIHVLFSVYPNSDYFNCILPVLEKLKVKALMRAKVNLYPNIGKFVENDPHFDYEFEHQAAILYLNTNDGFTILNDGTKIESVENRVLLFDGSTLHQSTHCTNQKARLNINFNYF